MEPVEIDLVLGGNVERESKNIEKSLEGIASASKEAQQKLKEQIAGQKKVIKEIESDIRRIEKDYRRIAPGAAKTALGDELYYAKRALGEEKEVLSGLEQQVEATAKAHASLRTQIRQCIEEMAVMERAGKRGTAEYEALAQKAGELTDALGDARQQANILAHDNSKLQGWINGFSGLSGAASAAVGAFSLFGAESEELEKIQTRLQSLMAVTIGLQQVADTLNKDSAFSITVLAKAKKGLAAATELVSQKLKISLTASKALMAGGIGLLIAGITAGIVALGKWNKKQKEMAELSRTTARSMREASITGSQNAAEERVRLDLLYKSTQDLNKPQAERLKAAAELQRLYPDYLGNLTQEEILAGKGAVAYQKLSAAIIAAAKARAIQDKIVENEKKRLELEAQRKAKEEELKKTEASVATNSNYASGDYRVQGSFDFSRNEFNRRKENIEEEIKAIKAKEAEFTKANEALAASIKIDDLPFSPNSTTTNKTAAAKEFDAAKELQAQLLDLHARTQELLLSQREDGLEKRLAQIDHEYEEELRRIEEKQREIIGRYNEANKDKKGFTPLSTENIAESLMKIDPELARKLEAELKEFFQAYQAEKDKARAEARAADELAIQEAIARYGTFEERRLQITQEYEKRIAAARRAGNEAVARALERERNAAIIKETSSYKTLMGDLSKMSVKAIENVRSTFIAMLNAALEQGRITATQYKEWIDEIDRKLDSVYRNRKFERAFGSGKGGSLMNVLFGEGDLESKLGSIQTLFSAAKGNMSSIASASGELAGNAGEAAGAMGGAVSGAAGALGIVDAIITAVYQTLKGVTEMMGSVARLQDSLGETDKAENLRDAAEIIDTMNEGVMGTWEKLKSGDVIGSLVNSVTWIIDMFSVFNEQSDRRITRMQEKTQKNLRILQAEYKKLQYAVDSALGTSKYDRQREQIEHLKKEIQKYYGLIAQEEQRKEKKRDQEAIAQWRAEIAGLENNINNIADDITESLAGTDARSLASDLASALVSAFDEGKDAARAMADVTRDVLRGAVINALKLQYLEPAMGKVVETLAGMIESKGAENLTAADRAKIEEMVNQAGGKFAELWQILSETLGLKVADEAARQGASQGIATASQDSIDTLNGGVYAVRLAVADIREYNRQMLAMQQLRENQMNQLLIYAAYLPLLENIWLALRDVNDRGVNMRV